MKEMPYESIRIIPPRRGACRICAAFHEQNFPHDVNSLYYRTKFRRRHGRYPATDDAEMHCNNTERTRGTTDKMDNQNQSDNVWIHRDKRMPGKADGRSGGRILAWHAYQGAMLVKLDDFANNPFYVYWMCIIHAAVNLWVKTRAQLPTKNDADEMNCIFAVDAYGDISITGYHQLKPDGGWLYWQGLPQPPSDYRELRKM